MSKDLQGDMVLDTSALIELLFLSPSGTELRKAILEEKIRAFVTDIALTEVKYILCRKLGKAESVSRMGNLMNSNFLEIEHASSLSDLAAEYKCERSLSLSDCFTLALGKYRNIPVLFARIESELAKEIRKKSFDVEVKFLKE
jgi:predicted nucleic acid-binding protein